ncbi:MAG: sugar ABC transporter permease [Treponema sp.]
MNIPQMRKISPQLKKETITAYLFLLPAFAFFIIFVLLPIFRGIYVSFFDYGLRKFNFIGFGNYIRLFQDPVFLKSLVNTFILVVGTVPLILIFSIFVAANIYTKSPAVRSFFRGVFYLPAVSSIVSITVVWGWIYHPLYGILNYVLTFLGVIHEPIAWLGDPAYALGSVTAVLLTTSVGQPIVLYTASLGNIPTSMIEAAEIDGATGWQVFKYIKWPALLPTTLYILIISTINSFQCFSLIQLLTAGGPNFATSTIMYLVYERSFTLYQFGYSSAMAMVLGLCIVLISTVQYRLFGQEVDY